MMGYFDTIVTGDMIEHGKPAPDIYLLAAERLGVDPAECVGVEDSPNGVRSIHAAGMRAVMIPDLVEPSPEVEALVWRKLDCLMDMIPLLEGEE
jgi:beta-phosphoglucomutase-like phosphatase (HAD superfamily)